MNRVTTLALLALLAAPASAQPQRAEPDSQRGRPIRVQIDFQGHPAMHIPWKFFKKGLSEKTPKKLSWRHTFRQTVYAPYLCKSGVRIFLSAAVAAERAKNPTHGRNMILEQFRFMEQFVEANSDEFAIARTPAEARRILCTTDKMVIVHCIEGAHEVLNGPSDAWFWRRQGVALITLIHLADDEFGGAAINPGAMGPLLNLGGAKRRRKDQDRGLSARGRQAIRDMANAGILVDLTHMSHDSINDALEVTGMIGVPPTVTHGKFKPICDDERAFTREQVLEIYRQGGVFSVILNGGALNPRRPEVEVPKGLRKNTYDMFQFHHETLVEFLEQNRSEIGCQKIAVGWASDWNGWTNHSKPYYKKKELRRMRKAGKTVLEIDERGLAHPGLLPQHWRRLRERGMDLSPMLESSERFLQVWEQIQTYSSRRSSS